MNHLPLGFETDCMKDILIKRMPEDKADDLLSLAKIKTLGAGEMYIREGEVPRKLAFLKSGLFRYLYINKKGSELTKGIITAPNFLSSYSAMIQQTPSYFYVEALEESEILDIPYANWQKLLKSDHFWVSFLLGYIEKGFTIKEKRERDLLLLTAEERYRNFLEEFPGLQDRLTLNIIASYLGIQPESLSRIRKNMQA